MPDNAKLLGISSVPRHARKVAHSNRVRLDKLCPNVGYETQRGSWVCCSSNYCANYYCARLLGPEVRASCVVNIDTGSCTPAVLTVARDMESNVPLAQLRFRLPRSTWDTWKLHEKVPNDQPCVFVRLLDLKDTRELLHSLEPVDLRFDDDVLHPHLASMLVGLHRLCPQTNRSLHTNGTFASLGADHGVDKLSLALGLTLVAVPPLPSAVEQCFTLLTHPSTYARDFDDLDGESDTEPDVPILQRIGSHAAWTARSEAASSSAIAKMFNDALNDIKALVQKNPSPYDSLQHIFNSADCDIRASQTVMRQVLQRYCEQHPFSADVAATKAPSKATDKSGTKNPAASASASASAAAPSKAPEPPPPPAADLAPSDEDEDVALARVALAPPAALTAQNRKRAATNGDKRRSVAKDAKRAKPGKQRATDKASDDDESDSDAEEDESDSSSVTKESEEEDDDDSDEDDDDSDEEEEEDESEDESEDEDERTEQRATQSAPAPAAPAQQPPAQAQQAALAWQEPCHRGVAMRLADLFSKHGDNFPELRVKCVKDACSVLTGWHDRPDRQSASEATAASGGVARAEAYNRLLSFTMSCLEDVLEERRPDRCVLVPRDDVAEMREAWRRATQLCETTLPQVDAAIAKLTELRDGGRATLLGVAEGASAMRKASLPPSEPMMPNGHA